MSLWARQHGLSVRHWEAVVKLSTNRKFKACFCEYSRISATNSKNKRIPRVEHVIFSSAGPASAAISSVLNLPETYVEDLIRFGAVFYSPCPPPPPKSAAAEIHEVFRVQMAVAMLNELQPLQRRTESPKRLKNGDQIVEIGSYARVHVHPNRFPRCYEIDWSSRILECNDGFVVLDKPSGIPVGGSVDNQVETCLNFTAQAIGESAPLGITHQLDTWTEGCLVLSRSRTFTSHFNQLLRKREVSKLYRALSLSAAPVGAVVHYMRPDRYPPRVLSLEPLEGWFRCELHVLDCTPVAIGAAVGSEGLAYESVVSLVTGRTHQLRAQFAAMGSPLVGDTMYGPLPLGKEGSHSCLESGGFSGAGWEPEGYVGLQAWRLWWKGEERVFEAGDPWWR